VQQWKIIAKSVQEFDPLVQFKSVLRHEKNANEKLESKNQSLIKLCDLPTEFFDQEIFCSCFCIFQELKEEIEHLHQSMYDEQHCNDAVGNELAHRTNEMNSDQ